MAQLVVLSYEPYIFDAEKKNHSAQYFLRIVANVASLCPV